MDRWPYLSLQKPTYPGPPRRPTGGISKNVWILLQLGFAILALQILDHKQNVFASTKIQRGKPEV
jgi:hypothetical protein